MAGGHREPSTRLITVRQLRDWLGADGATLARMRRAGSLPAPVPGTRRYDFEAVKRTLDRAGSAEATMATAEERLIERAGKWGKRSP